MQVKKTRKIIKAFDKYKLQEKINEHRERGWKQVGDIKMEGYYDGHYILIFGIKFIDLMYNRLQCKRR